MSGFVEGNRFAFFFADDAITFGRSCNDAIFSFINVRSIDFFFIATSGKQSCFIQQVGKVGPDKSRGLLGNDFQIDILGQRLVLRMHLENCFAPFNVRTANQNLAVKTSGTKQSRIQNIRTVRGSHDDNAFVAFKTVHFDQQLIQSLFTFIMSAAHAVSAPTTNGIDFIDENDWRGVLLGIFKKITDTAGTDTDKHFNEVRTWNWKERHARFARNGFGQQSLTCSGRSFKQNTGRNFGAQSQEFMRIAQEFNDFDQFLFFFFGTGNIRKTYFIVLFVNRFCLGLAKVHYAAVAAALTGLSHHHIEENDEEEKRDHIYEQLNPNTAWLFFFCPVLDVVFLCVLFDLSNGRIIRQNVRWEVINLWFRAWETNQAAGFFRFLSFFINTGNFIRAAWRLHRKALDVAFLKFSNKLTWLNLLGLGIGMISKHIVKCPHYPKEDYDIKKAVAEKPIFIVIIIQATSSFILLDIQINRYRNSLIISYLTFVNQKKALNIFVNFRL